jgi:tRNA threonylcarbamoyladenosine biosynthesis protein TsaB
MRILAIDTSCGAVSACVLDSGADSALARRSEPMQRGHAEALAPLLERLMFSVEGGFASLDRIAATVGPGSFTGIRVGLATARAIGLALNVPVIGVSTLVAFAGPLLLEPAPGIIASAIDARHGRVYLQLFEAMGGRPLIPARIEGLREAVRAIGTGPVRMTGSGAGILALEAALAGLNADLAGDADYPDILAIARIGLAMDPRDCPPRPLYLKPPDAQPASGESIARANL